MKRLSETSKWEKRSQLGPTMPHVEGLVTIHKNRVGHVDIKLESIGLEFYIHVAEKKRETVTGGIPYKSSIMYLVSM